VRLGGFLCGLDRSVHPPVAEWLGVICKVCVYVCGGGMEFVQDGGGSAFFLSRNFVSCGVVWCDVVFGVFLWGIVVGSLPEVCISVCLP